MARQTPAEAGELLGVFAHLVLVAAEDVSELGEGTDIGEEGTTRYAVVIPDWGNIEADGLAALADKYPDLRGELQQVEETFRDVSARLEVIVGDDTKLIHFLRIDLSGPERQQTFELAFTFDTPVTIEPPIVSR